jgi:purine-nucleoside/S-methyl-5'-thioadenosine phosphorylase / adenosine deaminase
VIAGSGQIEPVEALEELGFVACTTTRAFGSLGTAGEEPVREVMARWQRLASALEADGVARLATAAQVHGHRVITHVPGWVGWLRGTAADGHACAAGLATAVAVTVADCVPVFLAHPSGALALLHSGWRGTEARIVDAGIQALAAAGCPARELHLHLGPAICGRCYEVSPEVHGRLTGRSVDRPTPVDLRSLIAGHARMRGVRTISVSRFCTRCDGDRFFSHRAGDAGRQIAVMAAPPGCFA